MGERGQFRSSAVPLVFEGSGVVGFGFLGFLSGDFVFFGFGVLVLVCVLLLCSWSLESRGT